MRCRSAAIAIGVGVLLWGGAAPAQRVDLGSGSIVETVKKLNAGEYVWAPEIAPEGPTLLIVNLKTQRATLYRNGIPIGASTVSTGRPGFDTPTGVFTILQKHVEHYSRKYDNAPMPYMQRLTWYGIALHGGHVPGYPASHGCIRLPIGFAKLLYGSKFHRLRMSRGQQGIGISAAGMYAQLTTGKPVQIISRTGARTPAHYFEVQIDTKKNEPRIFEQSRSSGKTIAARR